VNAWGTGRAWSSRFRPAAREEGGFMLILGVILLVLGLVFGVSILWTLGIIVLLVGAVFWLLGSTGRPVAGRKYWY
jgi:hypothetical protein